MNKNDSIRFRLDAAAVWASLPIEVKTSPTHVRYSDPTVAVVRLLNEAEALWREAETPRKPEDGTHGRCVGYVEGCRECQDCELQVRPAGSGTLATHCPWDLYAGELKWYPVGSAPEPTGRVGRCTEYQPASSECRECPLKWWPGNTNGEVLFCPEERTRGALVWNMTIREVVER